MHIHQLASFDFFNLFHIVLCFQSLRDPPRNLHMDAYITVTMSGLSAIPQWDCNNFTMWICYNQRSSCATAWKSCDTEIQLFSIYENVINLGLYFTCIYPTKVCPSVCLIRMWMKEKVSIPFTIMLYTKANKFTERKDKNRNKWKSKQVPLIWNGILCLQQVSESHNNTENQDETFS